jgi:MFS family permease
MKLNEIRTFRALRNRDYALLWSGQLGHSASLWVETIARNWLIWELTKEGTMLATVNLLRAIPMLVFGVFAGVVADRVDKRKLLIIAKTFTLINKLVLATLIVTGRVEVWHVLLTAFLMGVSMSFEMPTRTALIPNLVKGEELNSAIALNSAAMNVTRIVGPAIAGMLLAPIGTGGVYFVSSGVYVATLVATIIMRVPPESQRKSEVSMWADMSEGFRYVWREKQVLTMMLLSLIPMVIAWPYMTLLPMIADKVLFIGSAGYGWMYSAAGAGALVSVLVIATLTRVPRKGMVVVAATFLFGVFLLVLGRSNIVALSMATMVCIGMVSTGTQTLTNTVLLTQTPVEMHGRVMGIYRLDRGLMPLGSMAAGALADVMGAPPVLLIMGGLSMMLAFVMGVGVPIVRKID